MKPKTTNHSTKKEGNPRGISKRNQMRELAGDFGPQGGMSEDEIITLGKKALAWALEHIDKPRTRRLSLRKFWLLEGLHPQTPACNWYKKYPEFKADCERANLVIGTIREDGMLLKELEPQRVAYNLHQFLPEYIKADKYHDNRAIKRGEEVEKKKEPTKIIISKE